MSKYNTVDVWNAVFGRKEEAYDYTGRLMKKSACGNPNSRFHPTLDHIRPLSQGGSDVIENIIICHRDTNEEKANHFPHWETNGKRYHATRVKGSRVAYEIIEDQVTSMGPKWCMNYDSGEYEWIDESGYSWDQGEYVYNWDRSVFDDEDDDW